LQAEILTIKPIFYAYLFCTVPNRSLDQDKTRQPAQHIVAFQTTACFNENNVSFYEKQRVLLMKTTCRFMKNNGLFSVNVRRLKTINEPSIKNRVFRSVKIPTITPSRARVRTHYRSFCLFAVTSVTPQS